MRCFRLSEHFPVPVVVTRSYNLRIEHAIRDRRHRGGGVKVAEPFVPQLFVASLPDSMMVASPVACPPSPTKKKIMLFEQAISKNSEHGESSSRSYLANVALEGSSGRMRTIKPVLDTSSHHSRSSHPTTRAVNYEYRPTTDPGVGSTFEGGTAPWVVKKRRDSPMKGPMSLSWEEQRRSRNRMGRRSSC